ncbi:MAG: MarR family transcriptional regulator [Rhodobacteraceae bacterium]|nr:MarR family transcriptional regulator [Paracoccaceae bacterium]
MAEKMLEEAGVEIPLPQMVTFRLSRLHAKVNAQSTRILNKSAGLSLSQWRIMVMIETHGKITPSEFVRLTKFDKGLVSRTVKGMITEGLLQTESSESDQRSHLLNMTAKGLELFETARPYMRVRQARLRDCLTEKERRILFQAFDKLEQATDDLDELL